MNRIAEPILTNKSGGIIACNHMARICARLENMAWPTRNDSGSSPVFSPHSIMGINEDGSSRVVNIIWDRERPRTTPSASRRDKLPIWASAVPRPALRSASGKGTLCRSRTLNNPAHSATPVQCHKGPNNGNVLHTRRQHRTRH